MPPQPEWLTQLQQEFPGAERFDITVRADPSFVRGDSPLRAYRNKVNAAEFEGKAPGSLLCLGFEGSTGERLGRIVFVWFPHGWNNAFRAETNRWEPIQQAATGEPIHESADFGPLAALQVKPGVRSPERWSRPVRLLSPDRARPASLAAELFLSPEGWLGLRLRNTGPKSLAVRRVYWWERSAGRPGRNAQPGGTLSFPTLAGDDGTIPPGECREWLIGQHFLEGLRSVPAALSPECYGIKVALEGGEVMEVPGADVGEALDGIDGA